LTELERVLAWAEWFCAVVRRELEIHPEGPDARDWRNWLFMVEQDRRAHRLSAETRDLFDDYRYWRERDPELKSLTASDPEDLES